MNQTKLGKNFTLNLEECALPYDLWENENGERFKRADIPTGVEATYRAVLPETGNGGSNSGGSTPSAGGGTPNAGSNTPNAGNQGTGFGSAGNDATQQASEKNSGTGIKTQLSQTSDDTAAITLALALCGAVSAVVLSVARRSIRRLNER